MQTSIKFLAMTILVTAPVLSFAQTEQLLTRAQVREQLIDAEKAGYIPGATDSFDYPHNIQAAEARIASQQTAPTSAYGSAGGGTTQSGKLPN